MPTSYKPVFIASILIALALFLLIMNSGSLNQAPTFIWVMTVWYMYKHDYQALVTLQTIMMGVSGLGTVVVVIASIQQDTTISNLLGLSPPEMINIGIISSCTHLWLLGFFKRQLLVDSDFTADNTAGGGGDKVKDVNDIGFGIWEAAAEEYDNNRNAGIWAMAFAESEGNEDKAKALYLKTRAEQLVNDCVAETSEEKKSKLVEDVTKPPTSPDGYEQFNSSSWSDEYTLGDSLGCLFFVSPLIVGALYFLFHRLSL